MRLILVLFLPWLCAACARVTALEGPPQSLAHLADTGPPALAAAAPEPAPRLKDVLPPETPTAALDAADRSREAALPPPPPALLPAEVYAVWVPDHLTDDDTYVTGHWVYVLHEPSRWPLPRIPTPATLKVPRPPRTTIDREAARAGSSTPRALRPATLTTPAGSPAAVPPAWTAPRQALGSQPRAPGLGNVPTGLAAPGSLGVPGALPGLGPPGGPTP